MKSSQATMAGGTLVAAGMMTQNVAVYAFNVLAARLLAPHEFGALTALFGIALVGAVSALGLQAVAARSIAVAPQSRDTIVGATVRVTLLVAGLVAGVTAVSTLVLTPALKLDSHWPVLLCGVALVPMTIMGGAAGVAQGTSHWHRLAWIYVGNGAGRLVGGTLALVVSPTPTSAMVGVAIGSWLPVLVGLPMLLGGRVTGTEHRPGSMFRGVVLSTHALLAFFVLSNMDSLIARNLLDVHQSGVYASGLILAKAAFFAPQFVSVVVFPDLARATTHHARLRAAGLVGVFGALVVAGTAVLRELALVLVGGDEYREVVGRLWLFALAGSLLAVVYLLVLDALAQHAHGIVGMIWCAVVGVLVAAYGLGVGITGLVLTIIAVTAALAVAVAVSTVLRHDRDSGTAASP